MTRRPGNYNTCLTSVNKIEKVSVFKFDFEVIYAFHLYIY